jgi:hypothetical protein
MGILVGAHWYFFYHAIKVSNVSVAMMGFSTLTLCASLVQPILLKKKIISIVRIIQNERKKNKFRRVFCDNKHVKF